MNGIDDLVQDAERRMDKSVESTQVEFNTVRTGRASAALLDRIMSGQRPTLEPVLVPPVGVVVRQSSDLLAIDDVADGEMKMVVVDGTDQVLVINNGGEFTAVQGVCSHEYFELDKGFLTAGTLTCALHLSRFDLSDGEPLDPPAELPLEVYAVVVENGRNELTRPGGEGVR